MHIRHIIVASDMSDQARSCYGYAAALARGLDARITILNAQQAPDKPLPNRAEHLAQLEEDMKSARVAHTFVEQVGDPKLVIHGWLREQNSMLVMGNRSAPELGHKRLGSTTFATLRETQIPVLVVPGDAELRPGRTATLLSATDLGDACRRGLRATLGLARQLSYEVIGAHVVQWPGVGIGPTERPVVLTRTHVTNVPADYEERFRGQMEDLGYRPLRSLVGTAAVAAKALLDSATEMGADIIAIPATGKGPMARLFLGSTTESLVQQTEGTAILVMPPTFLERYGNGLPVQSRA